MKATLVLLTVLLCFAGCSLIWSPSATVKKFMAAAEKGDVETMTSLYSRDAVQKLGRDKIRASNQGFTELNHRAPVAAGVYRMEDVEETSTPEGKRVSFLYKNETGTDSIALVFALTKEGGDWKIDNISAPEIEALANQITAKDLEVEVLPTPPQLPSPARSGVTTIAPAEPPVFSEKTETETKSPTSTKTISGGVLNGKAISLPKPLYPPIAKAAKASGTVTIQVLVDEQGNVVSAHALSGHPLLQATAITAARAAKFTPTKLSGQTVQVNGVIIYKFTPE